MLRFITAVGLFLSPTLVRSTNPEPCINSFTDVASNAIARSVFTHCIDVDAAAERHTNEDIEITDPLTTVRKYCPLSISTKMFHSAFYEILAAGWATPSDEAPPSRYNAIVGLTNLAKKDHMNHEARRKLGNLLSHIYREHLHDGGHCLTMEDRKAAIEDMETTLYKVRNIVGSIQYADLLYLKNTYKPVVTLESEDDIMNLKKTGNAGDGSSADHLRIMLDKPSAVYMSLTNGAPNSALIVGEDNQEIDLNLLYKSILKDTTPGTVLFLVTGAEFPVDNPRLVNIIAGNAQNKNILINVVLLDPKYVTDVSKIMYNTLALSTGGMMYETPRRQASDLIPVIESRFQPDQVTIVRNQRIPVTGRGNSIVDIPVDSTMSELIFEVFCPSLQSLMIYNPRYRPQRDIETLVATREHYLYSIKNVEPGNWQAQVKCDTDFYIEVRGQSPVDFFFTFANTNGEFKSTSPFGLNPKGSLNADEESKFLLVHSLGVENVELQSVQFKDEDKISDDRVSPLYLVESLVSAFPMPLESESLEQKTFQMAKIEGIDQSGFPVLRTHVIFPSKILLLTELEKTDFLPGVDSTVTVRVTNAYREIDLAANDFEDWIVNISPSKTSKTYYTDVVVTIRPPANTEQGKISSVTFTATAEEQKVLLGSITFDVAAGQRAKPTIESLHIDTQINNKFATTSIKSNIRNDHPEPREAVFDALVPPNALITGLRLFIGDEVFDSEIYPAKAVEKKPTDNKSKITINPHPSEMIKGHSPGGNLHGLSAPQILQRDAHRYEIKMNIDSWDNVTFELTYEELLERSQDRYQHWVSLAPSQIVPDMSTSIQVSDMGGIKWIRAFPLQSGSESFRPGSDAEIKWEKGDEFAEVKYAPSEEDQHSFSQDGITGRLMLVYDTNHEKACDAMIQNNFFVQTCLPPKIMLKSNAQSSSTAPYNVVFVMDKSGSMIGTKLDQTKEAFRSMISSLDRNAKFSIVGFNYATTAWRNKLVRATNYNVEEARSFISRISAGGGTNMHAALLDAIELCNSESSSTVPCMILFMTDGTPTVGVTEESRILSDVTKSRQQGNANIALNVIGFGAGISYSFLSRLSVLNSGIARQIFEDTNAAFQMQGFFDEVMKFTDARRTMKSVQFMYSDDFLDSNETTYDSIDQSQLGNGQEFTFAGKIKEKVLGTFKTVSNDLKIIDPNGEERIIEQKYIVNEIMSPVNLKFAGRKDEKNVNLNLAERIYRLQVIKQLIRERHIAHTAEDFNEVTRKLIAISSGNEHVSAYLSPVMSMSVTKPLPGNRARRSSDSFEEFDLNLKTQVQHVVQYEYRKLWWKNQAPEENVIEMDAPEPSIASVSGLPALFNVNLRNSASPACFDIGGRSGSEFNILKDDTVGIAVSGKAALDKDNQLYFDQVRVKLGSTTIIVLAGGQILKQTFDGAIYRLESDKMILVKDWQVRSTGSDCYLQYKDQIQIRLISDASSVGVELVSYEDGNSLSATGLLGQFASNNIALDQAQANLITSSSLIPVVTRETSNGQCWYTDDYTMKLLGRRYSDYIN